MSSSKSICIGALLALTYGSGVMVSPAHAISAQAKEYARQCRGGATNQISIDNCTSILSLSGVPIDGRAAMFFYRSWLSET
jgi:hypothetical protein